MDTEKNLTSPELPKPIEKSGENSYENNRESLNGLSPEIINSPMPGERMNRANDAVSQAIGSGGIVQQPIGATQASDGGDDNSQGTVVADDNDVIEKEWVDKAKTIVARTQGNPHQKSSELTYLKKDYMQKRYGKVIKIPEDQKLSAQN